MNYRFGLITATAIALLLFAPIGAAQAPDPHVTIGLERGDGHPEDHVSEVPESRRLNTPLVVTVRAGDFVCTGAPGPATLSIEVLLNPYKDHWAGSSVNPGVTNKFQFPTGQPGAGPDAYSQRDEDTIIFEIFWGEDRPNTGAEQTYSFSTTTTFDPTGCVPPAQVEEGSLKMTFSMPDIVIEDTNGTTGGEPCEENPTQAKCKQTSAPADESPAFELVGLLTALIVGVATIRRRQV